MMDQTRTVKSLHSGDIAVDLELRLIRIDGKPWPKSLPAQEFDAVVRIMNALGRKVTPRELLPSSSSGKLVKAARVVMAKANKNLGGRLGPHTEHVIGTESVAEGYRWRDPVEIEYVNIPVSAAQRAPKITVFPVIPRIGTRGYFLSVVKTGSADTFKTAPEFSTRQDSWLDTIPVSHDGPPLLRHEFTHNNTAAADECWWSAVVGLDQHNLYADWLPIDLRGYEKLTIEGRALFRERVERVPLLVRLEDATTDAAAGSFHHSTDWAPFWFTPEFTTQTIALNNFRRDQWAWWWNRHEVDFSRLLQITFGHDNSVPKTSGIFDIRYIAIE